MIYFVGIKGVGMTALAQVMKAKGFPIIGSDAAEVFMTDLVLQNSNITVLTPFSVSNIPNSIDYAVVSGAYYVEGVKSTNVEVVELIRKKVKILTYSQALGNFSNQFPNTVAVAGSHGKTTTSALLTYALIEFGVDPFGVIGSVVPQFGGNANIGSANSQYLVIEADEYQNHFLDLNIGAGIILNIDYDHPDFFHTPEDYYKAFIAFINKIPLDKPIIINGDDDTILTKVLPYIKYPDREFITFGLRTNNDVTLDKDKNVVVKGVVHKPLELSIPGNHNRLNALSCISLLYKLGFDVNQSIKALTGFKGTQRRLEYKGSNAKFIFIDDYAHHPTEILAGIQALRETYPNYKIHCIFQPHTFSRTSLLLKDFALALSQADYIYLLPIYGSARENIASVSSADMLKFFTNEKVKTYDSFDTLKSDLDKINGTENVIVTMGAGDVWKITKNMV